MIPTIIDFEDDYRSEFEPVTDQPSNTYKMVLEKNHVSGLTDGQAAMQQAIFKILQTERYVYTKVYSDNYGVELQGLIGQPVPFVLPEIERRITEALTWDKRINSVYDFNFDITGKVIHTTFKVNTVFGVIEGEMAVNF